MSIKLDNIVVTRKVPMTEDTCDNLRYFKHKYEHNLKEATGKDHNLSYPVVIDLSLKELRKCQEESE